MNQTLVSTKKRNIDVHLGTTKTSEYVDFARARGYDLCVLNVNYLKFKSSLYKMAPCEKEITKVNWNEQLRKNWIIHLLELYLQKIKNQSLLLILWFAQKK